MTAGRGIWDIRTRICLSMVMIPLVVAPPASDLCLTLFDIIAWHA